MSVKPSRSFTWQPRFRIWERENIKDNAHFCHSHWQFQMSETKSVSFYLCIRTDIAMPLPPPKKPKQRYKANKHYRCSQMHLSAVQYHYQLFVFFSSCLTQLPAESQWSPSAFALLSLISASLSTTFFALRRHFKSCSHCLYECMRSLLTFLGDSGQKLRSFCSVHPNWLGLKETI